MNRVDVTPQQSMETFVSAPDGLRLYVRCHGPRSARGFPVVCLPGLTRTSEDFRELAEALARAGQFRVLTMDYRGRGRSDYDPDPSHYTFAVELADVIGVMTAQAVMPAVIVGTSRGGLLAMLMAAARPTMLAGVVLNDIGPVIEAKGLMRIKTQVGNTPAPATFEEGADILQRMFVTQFPKLTSAQWLAFAHRSWREENGRLVQTYDPNLARSLADVDLERPLPSLWKEFDALARVPLMVVRGANSDLLSPDTVVAMRARRPDLEFMEIPDQGHTPLLSDMEAVNRIVAFVAKCSGNAS